MDIPIFMYAGFLLAVYAIIANDSIQTLGTFMSSNKHRPWWVLWGFSASILAWVVIYGWFTHDGDVSYGRLSQIPHPGVIEWWHTLPPICLLILTRYGIPASTTFLALSIFTTGSVLSKIIFKSLFGYIAAFAFAIVTWWLLGWFLEKKLPKSKTNQNMRFWVPFQWLSTGMLWSQWLIQDFANVFVYLPRKLGLTEVCACLVVMLVLLAVVMRSGGGAIQKIVASKSDTSCIRSASVIDLVYAIVLYGFKGMSNIPMSTTWVFIGVLAGREFAMRHPIKLLDPEKKQKWRNSFKLAGLDFGKAMIGLLVSLVLASGVNWIRNQKPTNEPVTEQKSTGQSFDSP